MCSSNQFAFYGRLYEWLTGEWEIIVPFYSVYNEGQ